MDRCQSLDVYPLERPRPRALWHVTAPETSAISKITTEQRKLATEELVPTGRWLSCVLGHAQAAPRKLRCLVTRVGQSGAGRPEGLPVHSAAGPEVPLCCLLPLSVVKSEGKWLKFIPTTSTPAVPVAEWSALGVDGDSAMASCAAMCSLSRALQNSSGSVIQLRASEGLAFHLLYTGREGAPGAAPVGARPNELLGFR